MKNPFIIGVAGESGASKTTIAGIISLFFGPGKVLIISTDDLHKYSRDNPAWNNVTHPDPEANNLELGDNHLNTLSLGKSIWRSVYNHDTGYFDPPKKMVPKEIIVIEGLHAFYSEMSQVQVNLKIFIKTHPDLTTHWKLIRDITKRGSSKELVLQTMERRRKANSFITDRQLSAADAIVSLNPESPLHDIGNQMEEVKLRIDIAEKTDDADVCIPGLFAFIKNYMHDFDDFVLGCETVGSDPELCQDSGGNISVKTAGDHLIIKASGTMLKDVTRIHGYSIVRNGNRVSGGKPSMETGFHSLLKGACVVHAHPIYLTLLLCLENSPNIIQELFPEAKYVQYANPGNDLCKAIEAARASNIYLLENHGIIVQTEHTDMTRVIQIIKDANLQALNYIRGRLLAINQPLRDLFFNIDRDTTPVQKIKFCFPDSAVLYYNGKSYGVRAAENYIQTIGARIGNLRYLSDENIQALLSMEAEQYRHSQLQ